MAISEELFAKLCVLCRLRPDQSEQERFSADLNHILQMIEIMRNAPTSGVAPLGNPVEQQQPLRPDQVVEKNERARFQALASRSEAGFYLVPKVLDS